MKMHLKVKGADGLNGGLINDRFSALPAAKKLELDFVVSEILSDELLPNLRTLAMIAESDPKDSTKFKTKLEGFQQILPYLAGISTREETISMLKNS